MSAHSAGAYTATLLAMVNVLCGIHLARSTYSTSTALLLAVVKGSLLNVLLLVNEAVFHRGENTRAGREKNFHSLNFNILSHGGRWSNQTYCIMSLLFVACYLPAEFWDGIRKRTLSFGFLGIISRVLRLEVSTLVFLPFYKVLFMNKPHWLIVLCKFLKP